jgi:hypothetical protein
MQLRTTVPVYRDGAYRPNPHAIWFPSVHQNQVKSMSQDALSQALVETEIEGDLAEVGLPVVTRRLESTGAVWVANAMGCPMAIPRPQR